MTARRGAAGTPAAADCPAAAAARRRRSRRSRNRAPAAGPALRIACRSRPQGRPGSGNARPKTSTARRPSSGAPAAGREHCERPDRQLVRRLGIERRRSRASRSGKSVPITGRGPGRRDGRPGPRGSGFTQRTADNGKGAVKMREKIAAARGLVTQALRRALRLDRDQQRGRFARQNAAPPSPALDRRWKNGCSHLQVDRRSGEEPAASASRHKPGDKFCISDVMGSSSGRFLGIGTKRDVRNALLLSVGEPNNLNFLFIGSHFPTFRSISRGFSPCYLTTAFGLPSMHWRHAMA